MIKLQRIVPNNYYDRSRDFQLIGRALDCVFNSSKTYSDMVKYDTISKNTDIKLLDLLAKTAGFENRRKYDAQDLYVLCSSFAQILQYKGTKKAIEDCVRVLLKAQNLSDVFFEVKISNYNVRILVPKDLTDLALLEDMLEYVLPAGFTYSILIVSKEQGVANDIGAVSDSASSTPYATDELGRVYDGTADDSNKTALSVVYKLEE